MTRHSQGATSSHLMNNNTEATPLSQSPDSYLGPPHSGRQEYLNDHDDDQDRLEQQQRQRLLQQQQQQQQPQQPQQPQQQLLQQPQQYDSEEDTDDDDEVLAHGSGSNTPSTISSTGSLGAAGDHQLGHHVPPPRRMSRIYDDPAILARFQNVRESSWKPWLRKRVPMFGWLISPGYNWKHLPDDIIAGITISTVVIPQSMAYAMLAPLPPVYGLFTSVMPIVLYCIFGTSKHMHTGTFAITTLLLGQAVRSLLANQGIFPGQDSPAARRMADDLALAESDYLGAFWTAPISTLAAMTPAQTLPDDEYEQRFIAMIMMLSFVVGALQVVMSALRMGNWASKNLLPDALVSGFNTAAVFHIGTSQLKHFLGIVTMPSPQGAFALLKTWSWVGAHFFTDTNWYTFTMGSTAVLFLIALRHVEQRRKKKHEKELRRKELAAIQQRQAASAAISQSNKTRQSIVHGHHHPSQPYSGNHPPAHSDISLRTVLDDASLGGAPRQNVAFVNSINNAYRPYNTIDDDSDSGINDRNGAPRTESEAEQALTMHLNGPGTVDEPVSSVYIPIPDILLCVILFTVVTVLFKLDSEDGFGIIVIGFIPSGLPTMAFPASLLVASGRVEDWLTLDFFWNVVVPMIRPALLIAVIIYVMSFSIAKQFGIRFGYDVDADQEMLALGLASMGGSCFSGYACTGSLTRTAILAQSGAKTPLASLIGVLTVVLTLICLTWCFERVPNTVLAAVVLVALQSLVMQIGEPRKLWRVGQRKQAIIWVMTFASVLIISVEIGIAIGVLTVLAGHLHSFVYGVSGSLVDGHFSGSHTTLLDNGNGQDGGPFSLSGNGAGGRRASSGENFLGRWRSRQASTMSVGGPSHHSLSSNLREWKRNFYASSFGQRVGNFFGVERPIFSDSLHNNAEDDDY